MRSMLRYYRDEDVQGRPLGVVDLASCSRVICAPMCDCEWPDHVDPRCAFGIVTPRRTYHVGYAP